MGDVYAVVLAGGSGTRFWPASRKARPKQVMALGPGTDRSLIAETVRRLMPVVGDPGRVLVATGAHLMATTREALPFLPPSSFLGEPVAKNTAPCIGWATRRIAAIDPSAIVIVVPSDQHVADEGAFTRALEAAIASAREGVICTLGIEPTRPETGFGYIEVGEEVTAGVRQVARFVEKPTREKAEAYLASGRFLWNAGMFIYRADAMLAAIESALPELSQALDELDDSEASVRRLFDRAPAVSIDVGVIEKTSPLHVVPANIGWSDLGSWQTAWELGDKDAAGNVVEPSTVTVEAEGNLVRDLSGSGRVIALVGVRDLCVVDTGDALLIMPRECAQDVRRVVAALEAAGRDDLL
jgi:mannose-1-phosphate guanylyltransferase